jgi:hypothetical protein
MTMKRVFLLSLSVATLCLAAPPAAATIIDFHFVSVQSEFTLDPGGTTGTFETSKVDNLTMGNVTHLSPAPPSVAGFLWGFGFTGGDFSLSMAITNISASTMTATGVGQFTITDTTADTITGMVQGIWTRTGQANTFQGTLSDVTFDNASGDNQFNGHLASAASMVFPMPSPWIGALTELSTTANWFSRGSYTTNSGSVDASVSPVPVPVPGAFALTLFGLGVGLRLRRYARKDSDRAHPSCAQGR